MAWRIARGLFRLWLVLSVLWIGFPWIPEWAIEKCEHPFDPDAYLAGKPQKEGCSWLEWVKALGLGQLLAQGVALCRQGGELLAGILPRAGSADAENWPMHGDASRSRQATRPRWRTDRIWVLQPWLHFLR